MKADAVFDLVVGVPVITVALLLAAPMILSATARRESRLELEGEDGMDDQEKKSCR